MTTEPVAVLDRQDVIWLLQAIGADGKNLTFTSEEYRRFNLLSPAGFEIIQRLQNAARLGGAGE